MRAQVIAVIMMLVMILPVCVAINRIPNHLNSISSCTDAINADPNGTSTGISVVNEN